MKELLNLSVSGLVGQLTLRRTSFREELSKFFEKKKKEELRADLQDVFLIVYLSFDLWTSRNRHAKTAIFRHYVNKNQQQRNRPLALRRQSGTHSGENIANMLKRVINEWGINMERAIIISDTAANNDTNLEALFKVLDLLIGVDEVKAHRVCGFGHIFTLIAKPSS